MGREGNIYQHTFSFLSDDRKNGGEGEPLFTVFKLEAAGNLANNMLLYQGNPNSVVRKTSLYDLHTICIHLVISFYP